MLKDELEKLEIKQEDIVQDISNYNPLKNCPINNNNTDAQIIKKESIINAINYLTSFKKYLGTSYKSKEIFNDGFNLLKNKINEHIGKKADFDYSQLSNILVLEYKVKVEKDATEKSIKEKYFNDDIELNLFNSIINCFDNQYNFYLYLDNLDEHFGYGTNSTKRNKSSKIEITKDIIEGKKDNINNIINKHQEKDLIIVYVFNENKLHIFTTQAIS